MVKTLLEQIEEEALDPRGDLPTALRRCVALGGKAGSDALRNWAARELKGYTADDELPEYRTIETVLQLDGHNGRSVIKAQTISVFDLPEFARSAVTETQPMWQPVAQLAAIVENTKRKGDSDIRLSVPGGAHLVSIINRE